MIKEVANTVIFVLCIFFLSMVFVRYMGYKQNKILAADSRHALSIAAQDAATVMFDPNQETVIAPSIPEPATETKDGNDPNSTNDVIDPNDPNDPNNISDPNDPNALGASRPPTPIPSPTPTPTPPPMVNHKKTLDRFYESLWYNLGFYGDEVKQNAFKMHIPVKAMMGYDALYVATWDDQWLPPIPYAYCDRNMNGIYYLTLGEDYKYVAAVQSDTPPPKKPFPPEGSEFGSFEEWRQHVIIDTINKALSDVAASDLNLNAANEKRGTKFVIPYEEISLEEEKEITPRFFAFIDGVPVGFESRGIESFGIGKAKVKRK